MGSRVARRAARRSYLSVVGGAGRAAEPFGPLALSRFSRSCGSPDDVGSRSGDSLAADGARRITARIAVLEAPVGCDVLLGAAGVLPVLVGAGELDDAARYGDYLASAREYTGSGVFWRRDPGNPVILPNFSHGTAGVCYALALAGKSLDRPDLLDLAREGAHTLIEVGRRQDGSLAVPYAFFLDGAVRSPAMSQERTQWGWCNGAAGTVQLFLALAALEPDWEDAVSRILRTLRTSGVPQRLRPGFGTTWASAAEVPVWASWRSTATRPPGRGLAGVGRAARGRCDGARDDDGSRHLLVQRGVSSCSAVAPTAARLPAGRRRDRGFSVASATRPP